MGESPLIVAVRSGDVEAVRTLLEEGADPDAVDQQGVPVICLAAAAFDEPVAEALIAGGADPDRRLPDDSTPLLRAVDSGSLEMTDTLLWDSEGRFTKTGPSELLARARRWHEVGTLVELQRRTGVSGPAERVPVEAGLFSR